MLHHFDQQIRLHDENVRRIEAEYRLLAAAQDATPTRGRSTDATGTGERRRRNLVSLVRSHLPTA